jgi:hypothetical protein
VFVPGKPFQTSLLFVCKASSSPLRGASERFFNRVGSCFTNRHKTRLKMLARDKPTSLLQKCVTYGCKKFYNIAPQGTTFYSSSSEEVFNNNSRKRLLLNLPTPFKIFFFSNRKNQTLKPKNKKKTIFWSRIKIPNVIITKNSLECEAIQKV